MSAIERLLKAVPYVRRPFHQRDVAVANLKVVEAELAATRAELAGTKAELEITKVRAANLERPISSKVRRSFDQQLWFLLAEEDARQDHSIGNLRRYVAETVDKNCPCLEIGPSFSPILPKSAGYRTTIIDHADQAGLVEKYTSHGVDVSKIEPVDIVWHGNSIAEATGRNRFDAIVAAHIIEHTPDLVQFLKDCSDALKQDGFIFLLVPDKRYTFDFMQPLSDVAKILGDHRAGRVRHSFESYFRLSMGVQDRGRIAWDQSGVSHLTFPHGDPIRCRQVAEQFMASSSYVDVHENYFTPISFAIILDELRYLGEIELELKVLTRPRECEFLAVLHKVGNSRVLSAESYLERKMHGHVMLMAEELERIKSAAKVLLD